jgi:uncharacterized protein (DUF3820 family)
MKGEQPQTRTMPYGTYKGIDLIEVPDHYLQWLLESSHDNFYALREELDRRENKEPVPTSAMLLTYGAYKGQPVTALPDTYLAYLINQTFSGYHLAKDELALRSANPDKMVASIVPSQLEPHEE